MASTQCYSDSEELNDYQNTRGCMRPSVDQRYGYKKSTSLTGKVKDIAHSARNKLHQHRHQETDIPFAQPVASHPHSGSQVPNKGQPVASPMKTGLQVPNKGQPVAGPMKTGIQVPNKGQPVAGPMKTGKQVPTKGQPVASHPQNGMQTPNKGHPVATPNGSSQVPNKGQPVWQRQNALQVPNKGQPVAGPTHKPELDLFHVESYNHANPEKKKVEGFVSPQQNVHVEKTKQQNYDSETESDDSDDETPVTKAQPVASHAQKPAITTFNMASNINANTLTKKDQAPVLPKQSVQEQKKVDYYYSETESESDSDDEASNKKN